MDTKNIHVAEKIKKLLEIVLSYYGKEIALSSVQHFSFDQIIDEENSIQGKYKYHIQYGFPQSGCVNMIINYRKDVNSFSVDKISVYAPTSDKDFVVTNFIPQFELDNLNVSENFGVDIGTIEHTSSIDIEQNPNAMKMLDMAINDLSQAEVLGKCEQEAPIGSQEIPICISINKPLYKEKR